MTYTFNGLTKRITLSSVTLDLVDLHSRWKDWVLSGNAGFPLAFSTVGGETSKIPLYLFLSNDWKIIPQAANHVLTVMNGVLETDDESEPFVDPVGSYSIRINRQTPAIAIGYSTTGSTGPNAESISAAVRSELTVELDHLMALAKLSAIGATLTVTPTTRTAGSLSQTISTVGDTTTVETL